MRVERAFLHKDRIVAVCRELDDEEDDTESLFYVLVERRLHGDIWVTPRPYGVSMPASMSMGTVPSFPTYPRSLNLTTDRPSSILYSQQDDRDETYTKHTFIHHSISRDALADPDADTLSLVSAEHRTTIPWLESYIRILSNCHTGHSDNTILFATFAAGFPHSLTLLRFDKLSQSWHHAPLLSDRDSAQSEMFKGSRVTGRIAFDDRLGLVVLKRSDGTVFVIAYA